MKVNHLDFWVFGHFSDDLSPYFLNLLQGDVINRTTIGKNTSGKDLMTDWHLYSIKKGLVPFKEIELILWEIDNRRMYLQEQGLKEIVLRYGIYTEKFTPIYLSSQVVRLCKRNRLSFTFDFYNRLVGSPRKVGELRKGLGMEYTEGCVKLTVHLKGEQLNMPRILLWLAPTLALETLANNNKEAIFVCREEHFGYGIQITCLKLVSKTYALEIFGISEITFHKTAHMNGSTAINKKHFQQLAKVGAALLVD